MGRPKQPTIHIESKVARLLSKWINESDITQVTLSEKLGLARPNAIAMFKQGRCKLPIRHIVPIARTLGRDPEGLMDAALEEYHPEILEALTKAKGLPMSKYESALLDAIRDAKQEIDDDLREKAFKQAGDRREDRIEASLDRSQWKVDPLSLEKLKDFARKSLLST